MVGINYWPEPTGIPVMTASACRWLARLPGWRVEVLTGLPHYPWWRVPAAYASRDHRRGRGDEEHDGVVIRRVPHYVPAPPPSGRARMRLDASWLAAAWLRLLGWRRRPRLVVLVSPPFLVGLLALWLRLVWRVPVWVHVQDLQVEAALGLGMLPACLARPLRAVDRFLLRRVDVLSTVGRGMRRRLLDGLHPPRPVALWPNWFDPAALRPWTGTENPWRARLAPPGTSTVALYAGNLGRKQGIEVVVEAARRLAAHPGLRFVIAGNGAERPALEAAVAAAGLPNLAVMDLVPEAELAAFLSAADIHLIPQRPEAADLVLPSKVLNILGVGRPLVATALPGTELAEVVAAAGCGMVVPPADPDALAAALVGLAGDPQRRESMGSCGRRWVLRRLAIDPVMARAAARMLVQGRRGARCWPLPR